MKVLCDFHHQALYHSLYLLFEKRLGWELYRQIGPEWYDEGFWSIYDHPATVQQYLGLQQGTEMPCDVHGAPLNESDRKNLHFIEEDGIYFVRDTTYNTINRAVRLEKFKTMTFDVVISSVPQHIERFNRLIALYQPQAKHVFQVGNRWTQLPGVQNIMASTAPFMTTAHTVFYHQEFDLNVFRYEPPQFHNIMHSYVHYMQAPERLNHLKPLLPGWQVVSYGAGMEQILQGDKAMAEGYRRSSFTWHFKPGGDGFGHTLYASYACGRPALVWKPHYRGCLGDELLLDGRTCVDTSLYTSHELAQILMNISQPEDHRRMCESAYNRFKEVVDFDREEIVIRKFLENLR